MVRNRLGDQGQRRANLGSKPLPGGLGEGNQRLRTGDHGRFGGGGCWIPVCSNGSAVIRIVRIGGAALIGADQVFAFDAKPHCNGRSHKHR
jgi:hypothetical protein